LPYPTAATISQLIADINSADKTGGAFTINLKPSTTFDLKNADNSTNGANGLPVIGSTKAVDLTINGNGDTIERVGGFKTTKQGASNAFRLFNVAPGASLTLQAVTLQGGSAYGSGVAADGGAIYNQGTLTVSNGSTLSGNAARYYGGDIYNAGGTVTVSNSTMSNNVATYGGAIYNAGTLTVSNCILSGNYATYGGGIDNAGGTVTVSNSTLSGNYATPDYNYRGGYGGGIYNSGGNILISASTLIANSARGGGGIDNDPNGTVTVQNSSSITWNTSFDESFDDGLNLGVLYLDSTSAIGVLDGNPAIPI
jgi:predicted outer membrane repeat protein